MTPDNSDGIVARPGPSLPAGVQGGNVLTLAAGVSTGSNVRPQVGVLTSNGTAEYYLYFSFFANGAWGRPECQYITACTIQGQANLVFQQYKPSSFLLFQPISNLAYPQA